MRIALRFVTVMANNLLAWNRPFLAHEFTSDGVICRLRFGGLDSGGPLSAPHSWYVQMGLNSATGGQWASKEASVSLGACLLITPSVAIVEAVLLV